MLQALRDYDPSKREQILSRIILGLEPDPRTSEAEFLSHDEQQIREKILKEISHPGAPLEVIERLSKELSELAFSKADARKIKDRLGQKGLLPLLSYEIGYGPFVTSSSKLFGIRKSHIDNAILRPDFSEHLLPDQLVESKALDAFSLFVKTRQTPNPLDIYSLLIFAVRSGAHLEVTDAWRVHHNDVDVSRAASAQDVLEAFTEKYGCNLHIIGLTDKKFVLYEKIPIPEHVKVLGGEGFYIEGGRDPDDGKEVRQYWFASPKENYLEVGFAFALDMSQYQQDLQKHMRLR